MDCQANLPSMSLLKSLIVVFPSAAIVRVGHILRNIDLREDFLIRHARRFVHNGDINFYARRITALVFRHY